MSRTCRKKIPRTLRAIPLALLFFGCVNLSADGVIIPRPKPGESVPPLTVKYHRVTVEISNQVAKTSIDQVFINNFNRDIEGTYIFPIPEKAAVSEFALWIGNEKVKGEILDSLQARRVYEDIVRRMRDPGLLEYVGRNMFRARVYPIPANGEKRVQLSYTEVLKSENNLVRYLYPLNTERFSRDPLRELSISARVESRTPILNVYSPSHKISVRKDGDRKATFGLEQADIRPDKDFVVYYSLSQDEVGLSFISGGGADDKYFLLLASPRYAAPKEKVINKDLFLVLDSSGSMSGTKIRQAKEAARFIVNHLDKGDRFSLIDFDDGVTVFSEVLLEASAWNKDKALKFVDGIEDSGGTNINEALLKALKMAQAGDRPNYILFLTDGLPTVGTTDTGEILHNLAKADASNARIFVFGVGDDVNTELLDRISTDHRGTSVYIGENEDLEMALSNYFEKISSPLLAELSLTFKGIETAAVYPQVLPDLFKGSQLVVTGKYKGEGPVTAVLKGKVGKEEKKFVLESGKIEADDSSNFLPRLWATRRIGFLMEEIRLHGSNEELIGEIKKLGLKYGIVTPYTSFLVTEKERLLVEAAAPAAQEAMQAGKVSGKGAVMAAKVSQRLKGEDQASQVESSQIAYKEDKTFFLKDGVWVDSTYKEGSPAKEVEFGSDGYFRLITEKPGIGKYLSVGRNLIICFQGTSYRIMDKQ